MKAGWQRIRLGDVVHIKHGFAFSGMSENSDASLPVVVGIGNFDYAGGFRFASTTRKRLNGDYPKDFALQPGDVLLAMTCQTSGGEILGIPGTIPNDGTVYLHNQRLGKVEVTDSRRVYLPYVFQLARWDVFNRHLFATASGSKILHTSPGRIEDFQFDLPPWRTQRVIAATLGALDDKIESNRRAIDLAEALGDALFARARAGEHTLVDVATLTMGSSPPGASYNESGAGMPFYQGVRDFGRRYPSLRVWTDAPVRVAQPNDTLISVRAPVGELNRAGDLCCIGRGVAAVSSTWPSTVYYSLRAVAGLWEPFQHEGTVFGAINRTDLSSVELPWSGPTQLERLEERLASIDARIESYSSEITRLEHLRDALLPELLSGRIRVQGAAQIMEAVA